MKLSEVKNGTVATIVQVDTDDVTRQRLKMLNVYPNASVQVIKRSLLNSSILLEAGGVRIGLRQEIAEKINVISQGV